MAMTQAGEGVGDTLLRDMRELRTIPHRPRILTLVGKGHNGGDALLATKRFLRTIPTARAVILPLAAWEDCRPLTQRAWQELKELAEKRIEVIDPSADAVAELEKTTEENEFSAMLDGFLGMQARLPLREPLPDIIQWLNQSDKIILRAAVDLPTGVTAQGTEHPLRADFTYCTGIVKDPVLEDGNAEWVYHTQLTWLYVESSSSIGTWFWSEKLGWGWTRKDLWPYIWTNTPEGWVYFFGNKNGTLAFWDYTNGAYLKL